MDQTFRQQLSALIVSLTLGAAPCFLTNAHAATAQPEPPTQPALQQELLAMLQADQQAMQAPAAAATVQLQKAHAERLKTIITKYGWPTNSLVGASAVQAAWLLVQHADHDKPFQLQVLALMQPLVQSGDIDASHYAYLYDRTHSPQRFGTQGECRDGQFQPFALEDPQKLDQWRAQYQLGPWADYQAQASRMMCKKHQQEAKSGH